VRGLLTGIGQAPDTFRLRAHDLPLGIFLLAMRHLPRGRCLLGTRDLPLSAFLWAGHDLLCRQPALLKTLSVCGLSRSRLTVHRGHTVR
jgi:hypothetical protein